MSEMSVRPREEEYTAEYFIPGFIPTSSEEEREVADLITKRAALKFTLTHPLYRREDITDILIDVHRRRRNMAIYRVKVSYWKKEAEQA